jgi:ORF6N domain-containing protein
VADQQFMVIEQQGVTLRLPMQPILYRDQPVITLRMMDELHQRPEGTAGRNFRERRGKLLKGTDYFDVSYGEWSQIDEFRRSEESRQHAPVILLTESGYLLLVKSFQDERAWQVQRMLVSSYFRAKMSADHLEDYLPVAKMIEGVKDAMLVAVQPLVEGQVAMSQSHKELKAGQEDLKKEMGELRSQVASVIKKRNLRAGTVRRHLDVILARFAGKCPCCGIKDIVDEYGNKMPGCHEEHYFYPTENQIHRTWLTCSECNQNLRTNSFRQSTRNRFEGYQSARELYERASEPILPFGSDW